MQYQLYEFFLVIIELRDRYFNQICDRSTERGQLARKFLAAQGHIL